MSAKFLQVIQLKRCKTFHLTADVVRELLMLICLNCDQVPLTNSYVDITSSALGEPLFSVLEFLKCLLVSLQVTVCKTSLSFETYCFVQIKTTLKKIKGLQ